MAIAIFIELAPYFNTWFQSNINEFSIVKNNERPGINGIKPTAWYIVAGALFLLATICEYNPRNRAATK